MPLVAPNSIDIEIRETVDNAIKNNQLFLEEMEKNKREFREQQAAMDATAKASEDAASKSSISWTDFRSMYSTVLDVVKVGQQVWDEFGQKFVDNAVRVGDLARMMGVTTEEASRLKEVADDVGIEFETVARAMKLAAKDGVEPNIESLAKLADEYNTLAPGMERTQFLMDKFGKSGDEMGKLLEKGGESIRKMASEMDEAMVVTEQAYEQARQYQISVDALKDSWDALTYQAAPPMVAALTKVVNHYRDISTSLKENGYWYTLLHQNSLDDIAAKREQADAALLAKDASEQAGGAFESEAEKTKRLADEAKAAAEAVQAISKANQEYLSFVGQLTTTFDSQAEKITNLNNEHAKLLEKKQLLVSQGYSEESKAIQDVNEQIDGNVDKQKQLADEIELANRRMILSMLEKQLAMDGLNEKETAYLLNKGLEWGVYSQQAVDAAKAAQAEVLALTDALNSVPTEKNITISISQQMDNGFKAQAPAGVTPAATHATGGMFMIPQSYGNEGFRMGNGDTASGGEMVTITPRGQSPIDVSGIIAAINNSLNVDRLARAIITANRRSV